MKSRKLIFPVGILCLAIVFWILPSKVEVLPFFGRQKENLPVSKSLIPQSEIQAFEFVKERMSGPGLSVYTNYLSLQDAYNDLPTGKDILSESQGLLLLYLQNRGQKEYFDLCLNWTMNGMYLENNTFSWVIRKSSERAEVNALIDDLRILKALLLAHEKWGDDRYLAYAEEASDGIIKYNTKDEMPLDFYDHFNSEGADYITIAYLDLFTMKKLFQIDSRWENIYLNSLDLITNAKIKNTGLYAYQYDYKHNTYNTDENISLIQTVYTMFHLAEAGYYDWEGMDWLWNEYVKNEKLYAIYSKDTHGPATDIESTALYALGAMLFYQAGRIDQAKGFLAQCTRFQVQNVESEIYGSFGNEHTKEVYSFDNLLYILSSSMVFATN